AHAVRADARLEAAEQLALEPEDDRDDPEHEGEDHDRLHDQPDGALESDDHQVATASQALISTGPSASAGGVRKTLPAGTPVRTMAIARTLSPFASSSTSSRLSISSRLASSTDISAVRSWVARKLSEGECSTVGPVHRVGAEASRSRSCAAGGCSSRSVGSSSCGRAAAASRSCQRTPLPPISSSVRPA